MNSVVKIKRKKSIDELSNKRRNLELDLGIKTRTNFHKNAAPMFLLQEIIHLNQTLDIVLHRLLAIEEYLVNNRIVDRHEYWKIEKRLLKESLKSLK
ncbi:MAG: hypothetical protein Q7J54_02385 [Candidatus Woesearchaeota archaeon]|nr:hypothetical protein [Candidatus Woesearchaeota archaeon]